MTRYAFIAAVAALAIGAAAPVAAQQQTEAQIIRQQSITRAQAATPAADGRQLIAELRNCEELSPQSVRERCEMNARKTGGQGVTLKLAPESAYNVMDQDQFDRFRQ